MIPIMSFWPRIYDRILNQKKLIEYRRTFPKDCTHAYMYISKPVKAICAIIYFGKKYTLSDWATEYASDEIVRKRIADYSSKYRYGMEIISIQKIKPITLEDLRINIPNFVAPQSYVLLENNEPLATYINNNLEFIEEKIVNDLSNIFPEHICKKD